MRITSQQFETLKLNLQGASPYEIARKLGMNPPAVYDSLKAAKRNYWIAKLQLQELEAIGFSEKIPPPHITEEKSSRRKG